MRYWTPIRALALLTLVLLVAGCASTQPGKLDALKSMQAEGDLRGIAAASVDCADRSDVCAQSHAIQGDACLRLARASQPGPLNPELAAWLDCAEQGYLAALRSAPPPVPADDAQDYYGGALLALRERRDRSSSAAEGPEAVSRRNTDLLELATTARQAIPGSAVGYFYGASAHEYRARLTEPEGAGCPDYARARDLLEAAPPPPPPLRTEFERLRRTTDRAMGRVPCPN